MRYTKSELQKLVNEEILKLDKLEKSTAVDGLRTFFQEMRETIKNIPENYVLNKATEISTEEITVNIQNFSLFMGIVLADIIEKQKQDLKADREFVEGLKDIKRILDSSNEALDKAIEKSATQAPPRQESSPQVSPAKQVPTPKPVTAQMQASPPRQASPLKREWPPRQESSPQVSPAKQIPAPKQVTTPTQAPPPRQVSPLKREWPPRQESSPQVSPAKQVPAPKPVTAQMQASPPRQASPLKREWPPRQESSPQVSQAKQASPPKQVTTPTQAPPQNQALPSKQARVPTQASSPVPASRGPSTGSQSLPPTLPPSGSQPHAPPTAPDQKSLLERHRAAAGAAGAQQASGPILGASSAQPLTPAKSSQVSREIRMLGYMERTFKQFDLKSRTEGINSILKTLGSLDTMKSMQPENSALYKDLDKKIENLMTLLSKIDPKSFSIASDSDKMNIKQKSLEAFRDFNPERFGTLDAPLARQLKVQVEKNLAALQQRSLSEKAKTETPETETQKTETPETETPKAKLPGH